MNSVPASESDGSHYDDDIDPMPASSAAAGEGKGKISEQPEYGNVTRVAAEQDVEGEEMFMNAPDSPPVPIRRSSRNGAGLHFRSTSLSRPNSLFPSNPIPRRRSSTDSSELLRRQEAQLPGEETAAAGLGIMNPPFADAGVSPKTAGGSLAATLQVANPSGAPQLSVPVEGERRDSAWSNDAAEGDPQDLASGDYPLTAAMDISPTPSHVSNAPSPAPVTPITPASPQAPPRPARSRSENKVSVANSPEKAFEPESEESKSSLLQRAKTSSNRASPMSGFDLSPTTPTASTSAALSPTALSPAAVEAVDPQTQAALEAELLSSADADDPSRPRTLKEARALAKERARLRKQASQANVSPTPDVSSRESTQQSSVVTSPVKEEPTSQPVKEVTRQGRPSLDG